MQIEPGTFLLSFPWNGELPSEEVVVLKDVDVVGVGALRRHQLDILRNKKTLVMRTHEALIPEDVYNIYQAELLHTLEWLRPYKTEKIDDWSFIEAQQELFSRLFPRVEKTLGVAAKKLRDEYLREMPWSSWLLQDHWRYFVGFLRQKFPDYQELMELAHWEWSQAWLEIQPFEMQTSAEEGRLTLNPSLQVVSLQTDNSLLERNRGMYAFVYDPKKCVIAEKKLDLYEAYLLDLVQEDRLFTPSQLVEMALIAEEIKPQLSSQDWEKKLLSLQQTAILGLE